MPRASPTIDQGGVAASSFFHRLAAELRRAGLSHRQADAIEADSPTPIDGEVDDLRTPHQVLQWYGADPLAAVVRIVPVVTHHEILAGRHVINPRVVVGSVVDQIERGIAHAVWQGFAPALDAAGLTFLGVNEVLDPLALDGPAVDVEVAVDHLDAVARQPDDAEDVIDRVVLRQAKHHDVTALRLRCKDAPGEQRRRQWQRIMAVAIAEFGDDEIISREKRRLKCSAWYVEGVKEERPEGQQEKQEEERTKTKIHNRTPESEPVHASQHEYGRYRRPQPQDRRDPLHHENQRAGCRSGYPSEFKTHQNDETNRKGDDVRYGRPSECCPHVDGGCSAAENPATPLVREALDVKTHDAQCQTSNRDACQIVPIDQLGCRADSD